MAEGFTKGPWRITKHETVFPQIEADGGEVVVKFTGLTLVDSNKAMAHAHLIAAAPELYEALDDIRTVSETVEEGLGRERRALALITHIARVALAKARGENSNG